MEATRHINRHTYTNTFNRLKDSIPAIHELLTRGNNLHARLAQFKERATFSVDAHRETALRDHVGKAILSHAEDERALFGRNIDDLISTAERLRKSLAHLEIAIETIERERQPQVVHGGNEQQNAFCIMPLASGGFRAEDSVRVVPSADGRGYVMSRSPAAAATGTISTPQYGPFSSTSSSFGGQTTASVTK